MSSNHRGHHRSYVGVEANAVFMNTVEVEIMYFKKLILFYLNNFLYYFNVLILNFFKK